MENKTNSGAIFKNTYKTEDDSKPDYKGNIDVDGKPKEIALWLRTAKETRKPYFSVKISEPYQKDQPADQVPAKLDQQPDSGTNDLPF